MKKAEKRLKKKYLLKGSPSKYNDLVPWGEGGELFAGTGVRRYLYSGDATKNREEGRPRRKQISTHRIGPKRIGAH